MKCDDPNEANIVTNEFFLIDWCASNSHTCHKYANCTDKQYSYNCSCLSGYTGDGKSCRGE